MKSPTINVHDRIHRNERSELVIEAYNAKGEFLPAVPIAVAIDADERVLGSRADWDYLEALRPGRGVIKVWWHCPGPIVSAKLPINVVDR